jgi:hypothetical protein
MNQSAPPAGNTISTAAVKPKEKILFDIQPLLLPTILSLENLTMVGFAAVIVIAAVVFHFGLYEFLIVGALYLLIAVPGFGSIFRAGSTSYVLTTQRLMIFTVGIGPKERSIPLQQITDVKCKSSGLQRFYGAGDVVVNLKALRRPIRLKGLKNCKQRAEQIKQAMKKA